MQENTPTNTTTATPHNRTKTFCIFFAMALVVAAYYPTIAGDYVPQDQWRAFKYSLDPGHPVERWRACYPEASKFYFLTGRWLVWIGECAEHTLVEKISDFRPLRVITLTAVVLSVILLRNLLINIVNSWRIATLLAVMVALLPGWAFMYYQGLTGLPVLISLAISLLSFHFVSRGITKPKSKRYYLDLGVGGILFISACLIYPIFAFAIIPLLFIYSAFRPETPLSIKVHLCVKLFIFYFVSALTYYLIVKTGILFAEQLGKTIPDLKNYRLDITTDFNELKTKLFLILNELTRMPLASFHQIPTWLSILILFSPAGIMLYEEQQLGCKPSRSFFSVILYLVSVPIVLIASISPWLLSHFPGAAYRHMLPIHFFLILSFGILLSYGHKYIKKYYSDKNIHWIESLTILILITIFSINQISLSRLQVTDSAIEINNMRNTYRKLISNNNFWNQREIHIIRPKFGRHYDGQQIDREFMPATMANPEHIFQMTHAVLREILSTDQLKRVNLVDCRFNRECVNSAPQNAIAITQSRYGTLPPELQKVHAIINYSNLKPNGAQKSAERGHIDKSQ
ncbi:MAG: glucosyltransferase domain-containing protein [Nitrospinota bacterium]|nr:glucosyltransferase domain-containing protein [Nitrospinota bacterium]